MTPAPPRIYCITATEAPTVAVFRRGPTNWSHVGQWDLAGLRYEPGAWLGGRIFPRRCDLSPDGRFLSYFAHKPSATWELGEAYVAVSKLPWLTALHAFSTCGTWTRGYCFTKDPGTSTHEVPDLPIPYRLQSIPAVQFATELRRGWAEAPDSPPRDPRDVWDEQVHVAGYTDNVAITGGLQKKFPSNKELSDARANSAAQALRDGGVSANLEAAGYGGRNPIATNTTATGRAKNRRVEIIVASAANQAVAKTPDLP